MLPRHHIAAFALIVALISSSATALAQTCSAMTPGRITPLNGFVPFAAESLWNTDISGAAVDANSSNIIDYIGGAKTLHPDFGAGTFAAQSIGIPYQIVAGSQKKVNLKLSDFGDESDPEPMPIPSNALVEGYPKPGNGDRHVIVLEKDGCWMYELYHGSRLKNGSWSADSSAIWDMTIDPQRPYAWTSADAAGLPIFAGLVRYDEVASGVINHALRFTVPVTQQAFTPPASHWASSVTDSNAPPMGTRLRLRASFDISSFSAQNQVILTALKRYGMILADNGSAIFISGAPDSRWNNSDLSALKAVTGADFDVAAMDAVYTNSDVPTGVAPAINSFIATPSSVAKGKAVTLRWTTIDALYNVISPAVGPVRSDSIVVNPKSKTTYTLYSTNQFGRTTATANVSVH